MPQVCLDGRPLDLAGALDISVNILGRGTPAVTGFGLPHATSATIHDISADSSTGYRCDRIALCAHTNGTHVESIAHVTRTDLCTMQAAQQLAPLLLTKLIDLEDLGAGHGERRVSAAEDGQVEAVLIRSGWLDMVLSASGQQSLNLDSLSIAPPSLTETQVQTILDRHPRVRLLGFDSISVDPAQDGGQLRAHRRFFTAPGRLIMELCRLPPVLSAGGSWALAPNIAPIDSDAIPCRPVLYPLM